MIASGILQVCLGIPISYVDGHFRGFQTPNYFSQMSKVMKLFNKPSEAEIVPAALLASFYTLDVTESNNPTYPMAHLDSIYSVVDRIINKLKMSSIEQDAFNYAFETLVHTLEMPKYSQNSIIRYALVESTYRNPLFVKMGAVIRCGVVRKMSGIICDDDSAKHVYNVLSKATLPTVSGQDLMRLGAKPGPQLGIMIRYFRTIMATSYNHSTDSYSLSVEEIAQTFDQDLSEIFIERLVIVSHRTQVDDAMKNNTRNPGNWMKSYEEARDFYQAVVNKDSNLIDIECELSEFAGSDVALMLVWKNKDAAIIAKLAMGTPSASMI
jgi:hypothetical protein